jgi:hypothetical protein
MGQIVVKAQPRRSPENQDNLVEGLDRHGELKATTHYPAAW